MPAGVAGPGTPVSPKIELFVDEQWVDVSGYVLYDNKITIEQGRRPNSLTMDYCTCKLTFKNLDGRFTPRHPTSPWYGLLGLNTPLRVSRMFNGERFYRFHGEVSEWPVVSDITGNFPTVSIEAAGMWRRLQATEQPLQSACRRALSSPSRISAVAYWPLEDGSEATEAASGLSAHPSMVVSGTPDFAADSEWTASDAIPTMGTGRFSGRVLPYPETGEIQLCSFIFVPSGAIAANTELMTVVTTGSAAKWRIRIGTAGQLMVQAYEDDGTEITSAELGVFVAFGIDALGFAIISFKAEQNGSSIDWNLQVVDFLNTDAIFDPYTVLSWSGNEPGQTVGRASQVILNDAGGLGETRLAHVTVVDEIVGSGAFNIGELGDVLDAFRAYNGETPTSRFGALCREEDVPFRVTGSTTGATVTMGDQTIKTLTELLAEAENTELGVMHESRDQLGLELRTRISMADQQPKLTLSYAGHALAEALELVDDDQLLVNDQYVTRDKGIRQRALKQQGRRSSLPAAGGGAGRYSSEVPVSVTYDQQVADQAGFRVRLGTVDQPRYPRLELNLSHPAFTGDVDLTNSALTLSMGDRVLITDLPDHLPPDDISGLVHGYTETMDQFLHYMSLNCVPEEPWQWAALDDDDKRANTAGAATTGEFLSGTDTTLTVATTQGPVWADSATYPGDFPLNITVAGVVLEVTGISGTTSPQTFTITQAPLNGVVKAVPVGSEVSVTTPAYLGLV